MFDDLLAANRRYAAKFHDSGVSGTAARGLAVLTCIDSRIDPLAVLGLIPGDAKILRNAGARATDDALRSLAVAAHALGATRICVIQHTDCGMTKYTDDALREKVGADFEPLTMTDQAAALAGDLEVIRNSKLIPDDVEIGGFIYDVKSGELVDPSSSSK